MSTSGIYGLSGSGIDVDSMVKMGMLTKQNEYDRLYKKEVKYEWRKEAYADLYSNLNTFNQSTLSTYKLSSTTMPMGTSSADSKVATASANANASAMSHTVNVTELSSNAYLLTKDKIGRANTSTSASSSIYLKDVLFTADEQKDIQNKMKADGFDSSQALISFTFADGTEADSTTSTISFTYDEIFNSGQTLNDLSSKLNSAGANIKASYDSTNDAFSLYQKDGGSANQIILSVAQDGSTASANGKKLIENLNLAAVKQTTDASGNITSSLEAIAFNTHTGTSIIGGSDTTMETSVKMAATDKLSTLFKTNGSSSSAEFTVNGKTITIDDVTSATVSDLIDKINNAGAGVTAALDATGQLKLTSDDNTTKITLGVASSDTTDAAANGRSLINGLSFDSNNKLAADTYGQTASGTSGKVTIDGKEYSTDTGKVSVGGVTYTLTAKGSTTVTVTNDTDKLVENVKKFVEDYNTMLDKLNSLYNEKQYSDYDVLTKSQENGMTADQISKWNEKAKSGLLYHDQTLGKIISNLREAIYTPVDSVDSQYNSMMAIGISSSTDRGHLQLDEDKLKTALANDPDCVYQIFASSGDVTTTDADGTTSTTTDYDKEGVMNRISDKLFSGLKEIKSYAGTSTETSDGSSLGTLILNLQTKMSNFKTMMDSYESALYKKYDAMETAIQQLSVSLGYITSGNS